MAMNLSEQEFDFSKSVEQALSKTLDLAKSAYVKVKAARDEHQAKQSEKDENGDDAETARNEIKVSASTIIANLILDTEDPSEKDMEAFAELSDDELQEIITKIDEIAKNFKQIPSEMFKALQVADFLDARDKNRETISKITSEVDTSLLPKVAKTMNNNHRYIVDLWQEVIESYDGKTFQSGFIKTLKKLSRENEKINQSRVGVGSFLYVGTKLVEVFRAQLQVLEVRLKKLKTLVLKEMSTNVDRPITKEHLKAVKSLVQKMK